MPPPVLSPPPVPPPVLSGEPTGTTPGEGPGERARKTLGERIPERERMAAVEAATGSHSAYTRTGKAH